jgi:putative ABC transport system permease protein
MNAPDSGRPGGEWLASGFRDLRYAARSLRRAPGFSLAVFLTLVVGIGPNLAVLSALYALVLKPLPFPDPGQLYTVMNVAEKSGGQVRQSSVPQCRDFQAHADLFAGFAVILHENLTLEEETAPARTATDWVTAGFFNVLGVKPVLGRFFTPEEEVPGRDHVLVLAQDFWESHYHADPGVIGRTVRAGGALYTIVGVAPRSLASLSQPTCLFQPYAPEPARLNPLARYVGDATLYARLKPRVAIGAGLAQLAAIEQHFRTDVANPRMRAFLEASGFRLRAEPLRAGGAVGELESLWLLQGGALLVLLIGCVNVVNLFLARLNAKRPELAIRVALGAGRAALLRQMLAESLMLTAAAAVTGVGVAWGALHVFNGYLPVLLRTAPPVGLEWTVIGVTLTASLAIALLVGLLPTQILWRRGLRLGDWRSTSAGGGARFVSGGLVIAQVAVAALLLIGASLLLRSFAKVMAIDPGFDAAHIVQGRIALPSRYGDQAVNVGVQQRILAALQQIPGVRQVAEVSYFGLAPALQTRPVAIRGQPLTAGESQPMAYLFPVSPDYFGVMGMHVLAGRGFDAADDFSKNPVFVVDQMFADRFFPQRIAVGQEMTFSMGSPPDNYQWPRIVGVVNHPRLAGLDRRENVPFVFMPMVGWEMGGFTMLVRSNRPTAEILRDMRSTLRSIDPGLPLYATGSLEDGLDSLLMGRRGITLLLTVFSGLALLLAAIGLYGVLAYDVSQRTREIGIRGAIGASRGQIIGLILRQGMVKAGVGLGVGLVGAIFLTRYLRSLLFDVTAADPASYVIVLVGLGGIALLASWLPARRAAKVDPIIALRSE